MDMHSHGGPTSAKARAVPDLQPEIASVCTSPHTLPTGLEARLSQGHVVLYITVNMQMNKLSADCVIITLIFRGA